MKQREKRPSEPPAGRAPKKEKNDGRPLDPAVRDYMEPRFQHDFSRVRVHTNADASESARLINARAYTVGDDIVFAPGHYTPETTAGRKLLAHELAHVVQQNGEPSTLQPLSLSPVDSPAEREAAGAADTVSAGGRFEGGIRTRTHGLLQRDASTDTPAKTDDTYQKTSTGKTVAADIAGTLVGGGIGAGLGFLIGGPIGAVIFGILGAFAGLLLADTGVANAVPLTEDEIREADKVFKGSLDYKKVRKAESALMTVGGAARTPFNTIYFPPGEIKKADDFWYMHWLIHELTHTWQTQHGLTVVEKLFWALHGKSVYNYGGEDGLVKEAAAGKHFLDFDTEKQAAIAADYYKAIMGKGGNAAPFLPFILELQDNGKKRDTSATTPGSGTSPGPSPAPPAPAGSGGGTT